MRASATSRIATPQNLAAAPDKTASAKTNAASPFSLFLEQSEPQQPAKPQQKNNSGSDSALDDPPARAKDRSSKAATAVQSQTPAKPATSGQGQQEISSSSDNGNDGTTVQPTGPAPAKPVKADKGQDKRQASADADPNAGNTDLSAAPPVTDPSALSATMAYLPTTQSPPAQPVAPADIATANAQAGQNVIAAVSSSTGAGSATGPASSGSAPAAPAASANQAASPTAVAGSSQPTAPATASPNQPASPDTSGTTQPAPPTQAAGPSAAASQSPSPQNAQSAQNATPPAATPATDAQYNPPANQAASTATQDQTAQNSPSRPPVPAWLSDRPDLIETMAAGATTGPAKPDVTKLPDTRDGRSGEIRNSSLQTIARNDAGPGAPQGPSNGPQTSAQSSTSTQAQANPPQSQSNAQGQTSASQAQTNTQGQTNPSPAQVNPQSQTNPSLVQASAQSPANPLRVQPGAVSGDGAQSKPAQTPDNGVAGAIVAGPQTQSSQGQAPLPAGIQVSLPAHAPDLPALAVAISAKSLSGAKQFDIRLDPPELGRVDVRLSIDTTGKVSAHLSADQPETLKLLQRDAPTLTRTLRDAGLNMSQNGLNFSLRQQSGDSGSGHSHSRGGNSRSFALTATASISAVSAGAFHGASADGRLDIRV